MQHLAGQRRQQSGQGRPVFRSELQHREPTIGYRRILKLSESVTTSKVRLRITSSRARPPAIDTVSLHNDQS
ncbi:hypothetical protein [Streptomyces sp. NPDC021622]|uniref:hypothetical protein n=1 Tax=Streptomyces sp. NPDC021622 TaxID=3155013 RepID=UPI0033FBABB8